MEKEKCLSTADVVCSEEFVTGFSVAGRPMIEKGPERFFDGFAIILDPADKDVTDPTCLVMLSSGKILRIKEERLITVIRHETYEKTA